jgi:hypothetical protein
MLKKKYVLEYQKVSKECKTIIAGYNDNFKKLKYLTNEEVILFHEKKDQKNNLQNERERVYRFEYWRVQEYNRNDNQFVNVFV